MDYCEFFGISGVQILFNDIDMSLFKQGIQLLSESNNSNRIKNLKIEIALVDELLKNGLTVGFSDKELSKTHRKLNSKIVRTENYLESGKELKSSLVFSNIEELEKAKKELKDLVDKNKNKTMITNSFYNYNNEPIELSSYAFQVMLRLYEVYTRSKKMQRNVDTLNNTDYETITIFDRPISYYLSDTNNMTKLIGMYRKKINNNKDMKDLEFYKKELLPLSEAFGLSSVSDDSSVAVLDTRVFCVSSTNPKGRDKSFTTTITVNNAKINDMEVPDDLVFELYVKKSNTSNPEYSVNIQSRGLNTNIQLTEDIQLFGRLVGHLNKIGKLNEFNEHTLYSLFELFKFTNSLTTDFYNSEFSFYVTDENGNKKNVKLNSDELYNVFRELEEIGVVGFNLVTNQLFLNSLDYINLRKSNTKSLDNLSNLAKAVFLVEQDLKARMFIGGNI